MGRGPSGVLATGSILMVSMTAVLPLSNTVTTPPFSQVTKPVLPSRVKTMARGRGPVSIAPTTVNLRVSTAVTWLPCSLVT